MQAARSVSVFKTTTMRYYVLLAGLYTLLIFSLPPNAAALEAYNLRAIEYRVIMFGLALPSMAVWLAAFIGYTKLHQYARAIRHSPEGTAFEKLATGCSWLAWSLPITAIIPMLLHSLAGRWNDFQPTAIILTNYLSLILPLIAFVFIAQASRLLLINKKNQAVHLLNSQFIILIFLVIGVAYCYFTFRQFDLTSLSTVNNPYFLPVWLMVLTVTVPFLYAWFIGLLASYEIMLYSRLESGVLYRQALILVSCGLLAVVLSSIALQYLNGVMPRAGHLVLDHQLALTLFFRIVGGAGFVMLATGASRLKKIEDI